MHGSCNYATQVQHTAAKGVHLCCTGAAYGCIGPALMLHRASMWLHGVCNCLHRATRLHRACNHAAQGQQMAAWGFQFCCTGPACGLQLYCTRPAYGSFGVAFAVRRPACGCIQPAIMLHKASMYLHRACTKACQHTGTHLLKKCSDGSSRRL